MEINATDMTLYQVNEDGYEPIYTWSDSRFDIGVDLAQNTDMTAVADVACVFEPNGEVTYDFVVIDE